MLEHHSLKLTLEKLKKYKEEEEAVNLYTCGGIAPTGEFSNKIRGGTGNSFTMLQLPLPCDTESNFAYLFPLKAEINSSNSQWNSSLSSLSLFLFIFFFLSNFTSELILQPH